MVRFSSEVGGPLSRGEAVGPVCVALAPRLPDPAASLVRSPRASMHCRILRSPSVFWLEELFAIRAVQVARVNCNLIEGDNSECGDIPEGAKGQFPGARNRRELARVSEIEGLILTVERLVLFRIVGEFLIDQLLAIG